MNYPQTVEKVNVLILSDDRATQKSLYELLCRNGYIVDITESVEGAVSHIEKKFCHVILTDMYTAGLELLKIINNSCPIPMIMLTSYSNIEFAVKSVKMGVFDYLLRPVEDKKIISAIERASTVISPLEKGRAVLKKPLQKEDIYHDLLGRSNHMKNIYSLIGRIANAKATVLLCGESGTGKRVIAHAIHEADSTKRDRPFIEVSCGALPKDVIESELFGHTKGAFTGAIVDRKGRFELAHSGTILLDDIDCFSLELQAKLLRVLQEKEFERVGDNKTIKVDARVIAATNQDLRKAVNDGRFREDLYYRINVISIKIPPLRERKEDLHLFITHFVNFYSKENNRKIKKISQEALQPLLSYDWPGNVRELENIIERAVILDVDDIIDKDDLPESIFDEKKNLAVGSSASIIQDRLKPLKEALREPEKVHILNILQEVGWNKKKAALRLGVNRTTLYNKLRLHNIGSNSNSNKNN